ncbi:forkhead box protein D1-like [Pelobates fuscus]|uniref:forkhead box protein D1-like n=1 Tax=Pelobates fuscus TaxID=191477 RepID=UPI002FE49E34
MPSAARVLGASFLIDSLIGWTPGHQHNTFQDLKSLTSSSQSDEVVEVPQSTPSEVTARTAENSQPGKKLWIQEDNPSKVKAEFTNASQFKNELDIPKRRKSDGREWAPGIIHSEEKPELFDTNHLKDNTGTSKSNNSEIHSMKVPEKPNHSYIALISRAILSSPEKRLQLSDIYQWIMETYPYYHNQEKSWRNSVRHNLSLNECFIKAGRSDNGKGHYWAVHPANLEAFSRGDYQRRRARRRVRRVSSILGHQPHFPSCTLCCFHQQLCICCPPLNPHSSLPQIYPLTEQPSQQTRWPFPMPVLWPFHQMPPYV